MNDSFVKVFIEYLIISLSALNDDKTPDLYFREGFNEINTTCLHIDPPSGLKYPSIFTGRWYLTRIYVHSLPKYEMAFVADACSFVDLIRSDASSGEIKLSASVSYMSKSQTYPATLDVKTHGELNLPIKMLDTTVNFKGSIIEADNGNIFTHFCGKLDKVNIQMFTIFSRKLSIDQDFVNKLPPIIQKHKIDYGIMAIPNACNAKSVQTFN